MALIRQISYLVSLGGKIINVSSRRSSCKWIIFTIENHCKLTEFGSPWANCFLNKEMKQVCNSNRKVKIGEYDVRLLPLELDVMFVLVHLLLHFIYEGIGLRKFAIGHVCFIDIEMILTKRNWNDCCVV